MEMETRWQKAFYETDIRCDANEIFAFRDGCQGIWREDEAGELCFIMKEGLSSAPPLPRRVVNKKGEPVVNKNGER